MARAVGIDLGTTYSAVSVMRESGKPEILRNSEGQTTTPSVVFFQEYGAGDEPLVGVQAKNMAATNPLDVVQFVKRQLGDKNWRFDSMSGASYSAEEVSAIILKRLKQDAELALGEPVTDAVITVPAYFDDSRRTATRHAGEIAGFNVLRVINEPTAAALSYGLDSQTDGTVLVYDLGGGTFDVTLMRISGATFDVIATEGDRNLGGFDFDNAIVTFVAEQMREQGAGDILADMDATAALREKAEQAKCALSTVASTNIHVSFEGTPYRVQVTREDFERVTRSLVTRTTEILEEVLEAGEMGWDDIDKVLLVGGSTRTPVIRDTVARLSGKQPELSINPDEAVALGAAIQAAVSAAEAAPSAGPGAADADMSWDELFNEPIQISDVASQALGVLLLDDDGKLCNTVVIPQNAKVPSKHSTEAATVVDEQTQLRVRVTQGADPDPDFVTVVGESLLNLPPYPAGSPVRITYHYDIDQTIFIEVDDLVTGSSLGNFSVDRLANMADEDVLRAAAKINDVQVS